MQRGLPLPEQREIDLTAVGQELQPDGQCEGTGHTRVPLVLDVERPHPSPLPPSTVLVAVRSAEASSRVGLCSDTGHRCRSIHTDWAVPPHQIFFAFLDESESFKSKSNSKTRVNSCINHTYKVGKGGRKGGREGEMEVGGEGVGIGGWRLTALKYFLSH